MLKLLKNRYFFSVACSLGLVVLKVCSNLMMNFFFNVTFEQSQMTEYTFLSSPPWNSLPVKYHAKEVKLLYKSKDVNIL